MDSTERTEHYYSRAPQVAHDERVIECKLRGLQLSLRTDAGVFSKARIDRGTELLIESLDIGPGERVLDLGCGYGPVGIVAALMEPSSSVVMVDVNERAVYLARLNAEMNGARNAEALQSDGFETIQSMTFNRVFTNPPYRAGKTTVLRLLEECRAHLEPGGKLYVVGQRKQGIKSIEARMTELFDSVTTRSIESGYRVLVGEVDAACRSEGLM